MSAPVGPVWAIVLNWNGLPDTLTCLASLQALTGRKPEILVVDNGSSDDSVALLATMSDVGLLALETNLGFAAGMNAGMAHALAAGASYVLLLNNDAQLAPDALALLTEALEADPLAALAAPTIYVGQMPGKLKRWYAGGETSRWTGVATHWTGPPPLLPRAVNFASGCCLLIRTSVFMAVGGFREDYFLYFEDVEFCDRVTAGDLRVLHVGAAEAWHAVGASTGSKLVKAASLDYYDVRNGLAFIRDRRYGLAKATAWAYFLLVRLPRKFVRIAFTPGARRASTWAVMRGCYDAVRGRMGAYQRPGKARG
jgi:GT2 family glycosyltransferase